MFKKIIVAGVSALFGVNAIAAEPIYEEELPIVWSSIITATGGGGWATPGQNRYMYPLYPALGGLSLVALYANQSDTGGLVTGEMFFGLQRVIAPLIIGELGVGVAGASDAKIKGLVKLDNLVINSYQYKVNHARVEIKGKMIWDGIKSFQPYLTGAFGASFNNSHDYQPTETFFPNMFPPSWFLAHTNYAFTYTVGAGIQTMITPHWQIGVNYQFVDWGRTYLGPDSASIINDTAGIGTTHLYTNEALLSIGYLY